VERRRLHNEKLCYLYYSKYYAGDQIKEDETGGECGTYGRQERCIQGSGGRNLRKRDNLEYLVVDKRIILKWIYLKWHGEAWTGLIWLRIGTGGGLLRVC
jgi:hypothetical protein